MIWKETSKIRVAVLGSTGMLGNAVGHYFDGHPDYDALLSFRNRELAYGEKNFYFDAMDSRSIDALPEVDYVINCIGCVKQRDHGIRTYMKVNAQFPHFLAAACERTGARLIHITTDCVFSGRRGRYHELDEPDCEDNYGVSKELGEPRNCMVLRTSVVGPELRAHYSLLDWARSQKGSKVQGYTNHLWNGITSLEYAKVCDKIIQNDWYEHTLRHLFGTTHSKQKMLYVFNNAFALGLTIEEYEHPDPIDRTLSTVYSLNDRLKIPDFHWMVKDLTDFMKEKGIS